MKSGSSRRGVDTTQGFSGNGHGGPNRRTLDAWQRTAESCARRAGWLLRRLRAERVVVTRDRKRDVKLVADRASEAVILDGLRRATPCGLYGEERGSVRAALQPGGWRWLIDPLDGSLNYLRGVPICGVSIGLWNDAGPVLGVVYDFNRDELFAGRVGAGASVNGERITVSRVDDRARATLATGFPAAMALSAKPLALFMQQARQYRKLRLFGSAALSLCYVAAGRVDAYYEQDIRWWDVAGGLAIVEAAGGRAIWRMRQSDGPLTVLATNSRLPMALPGSGRTTTRQRVTLHG